MYTDHCHPTLFLLCWFPFTWFQILLFLFEILLTLWKIPTCWYNLENNWCEEEVLRYYGGAKVHDWSLGNLKILRSIFSEFQSQTGNGDNGVIEPIFTLDPEFRVSVSLLQSLNSRPRDFRSAGSAPLGVWAALDKRESLLLSSTLPASDASLVISSCS